MKGSVLIILSGLLAGAGIPGNMPGEESPKTAFDAAAAQTRQEAGPKDSVLEALEHELLGQQPVSRDPTKAIEDHLRPRGRRSLGTLFP